MTTEPPGAWVYTEQERVRADAAEELNKRYKEALERIEKGELGPEYLARKALGDDAHS